MTVHETSLPGLLRIVPTVYGDARGFFLERFHAERYAALGLTDAFVQDNHSRSQRGTLRGLHYQISHPQGKLVECARGAIYDVAVDLRPESPTFGQWEGVELSDANHHQLWIPPGFAHGFCVLSEEADVLYKCTEVYRPDDEGGLAWDDPDLGIAWPITEPTLSDKDRCQPLLCEVPHERLPQAQVATP